MNVELSVGEALLAFRRANGLAADSAPSWTCDIGPLRLRLPNFRWRRRAIPTHDLHHLLTGYPCTLRGECQMAAWEFAAGRFPHPAATLFCLPLVAAGLLWSPRALWSAFLRGRRSASLYATGISEALLASPLHRLRDDVEAGGRRPATFADAAAFGLLAAQAAALVFTPALAVTALAIVL